MIEPQASSGDRSSFSLVVGERELPLEPDRIYVIGSDDKADLRLRHASVAPHHATISVHDGELTVEANDSLSPVVVDGKSTTRAVLPPGTTFSIGQVEVRAVLGPLTVSVAATSGVAAIGAASPDLTIDPVSEPARGRREDSFAEIMGDQLRRAPWFTLSLAIHALLLWILYLALPAPERSPEPLAIQLNTSEEPEPIAELEQPADEAVEIEDSEAEQSELAVDDFRSDEFASAEESELPFDDTMEAFAPSLTGSGDTMAAKLGGGSGGDDILSGSGSGSISSGFRKTVTKLRESGLEIMFVFDSTGSMDPVLAATKRSLMRMLEVMHALVPDARVGIVTYRDHGNGEEYLTRGVPLERDYYRSLNFMQTIEAKGGGDRPEAVLAGLDRAIDQKWHKKAKRVVVLIGDAPAHKRSNRKLDNLVRKFARDGKSFVHVIMTSPRRGGRIEKDTEESLSKIAKSGKGACLPLSQEDTVLMEVMSLAFGEKFRSDIDDAYRIVQQRSEESTDRFRQMVADRDLDAIESGLNASTVDDRLVRSLASTGDREVTGLLLDVLTKRRFSEAGRQAAAYALQQALRLRLPPIDTDDPGPLDRSAARELRRVIEDS